tara:strand:+ start:2422 stop:3072 length:651 start_codon:yes stop_codon:yes gene_type:complete
MISNNLKNRIYTSLILLSLVLMIFNSNFILIYCLIILGVLSIIEFTGILKKIPLSIIYTFLANFIFIIYISVFCFMFFFFSNLFGLKTILFILLIGCIASDIGGFIFGKIFNGPKLTKISPKKTYAGSLGSIILTLLVVSSLFFYSTQSFEFNILIIAFATSVSCQIGDLVFSFLKRKAKIKDTGNFLPGHGGVLDRIDGILLGIPIGFLTLILLN